MKYTQNTKILCVRSAHLGDFIVIVPFIEYLKKTFGISPSQIDFLVLNSVGFDPVKEIYSNEQFGTSCIINTSRGWFGIIKQLDDLKKPFSYDIVLYLPFYGESFLKRVLKFILLKLLFPLTKVEGCFSVPHLSVSQYAMPFLAAGIDQKHLSGIEERLPRKISEKLLIGLYINSKLDMKIWPAENFRQVVDSLCKKYDCEFFLLGSNDDFDYNQNFISTLKNINITNLAGTLSIKDTISFMNKLDCLIANDGSPIHMAGLSGTKVISVFTYKEPVGVWEPISRGSISIRMDVPCKECYLSACQDVKCLKNISAEEVFRAVEDSLLNPTEYTKSIVLRKI